MGDINSSILNNELIGLKNKQCMLSCWDLKLMDGGGGGEQIQYNKGL